MKTILLLAFSLSTALAQFAQAEDQEHVKQWNKRQAQTAQTDRRTVVTQTPKIQHQTQFNHTPHVNVVPRVRTVSPNQTYRLRSTEHQDMVRANRLYPNQNSNLTPRVYRNPNVVLTPRTDATVQANVNARNRFDRNNRTDRNPPGNNSTWAEARRHHHRDHHDRAWWRSHFNRFVIFGGGYYYWNNGYWYPAYGYDDSYRSYSYDEPIYGYEDQDPGQTISSVQTELQRLGYYRYAVDGLMGPATRAAIANFQRDHGLAMTSAIDRPTLQSLGLG